MAPKRAPKNLNYLLSDSELISDRPLEITSGQSDSKAMFFHSALISQSWHNKVSQIGRLKRTEMYSLRVKEARSQQVGKVMLSLKTVGENPSLPLSRFW